jgi:hypothetical protein
VWIGFRWLRIGNELSGFTEIVSFFYHVRNYKLFNEDIYHRLRTFSFNPLEQGFEGSTPLMPHPAIGHDPEQQFTHTTNHSLSPYDSYS